MIVESEDPRLSALSHQVIIERAVKVFFALKYTATLRRVILLAISVQPCTFLQRLNH